MRENRFPNTCPIENSRPALRVSTAGWYMIIGLAALAMRLYDLGDAPLNKVEATEALLAWELSQGGGSEAMALPASPLLHTLQAASFWMVGAGSPASARFWPALGGTVVIFAPALFRKQLGELTALVSTGMMAVSPALLSVSRTGDGRSIALVCLMGVVGGIRWFCGENDRRGLYIAGIALGAGLASGDGFLAGSVIIAAVCILRRPDEMMLFWRRRYSAIARLAVAAILSFALSATVAFQFPIGLLAAGKTWADWLTGWAQAAKHGPAMLPITLSVLYEPLAVVFGLLAICFALRRDIRVRTLAVMMLAGIAYAVGYPGREPSDVLWFCMPLGVLASILVVDVFNGEWDDGGKQRVAIQAGVLIMMLGFSYATLAGYTGGMDVALAQLPWGLVGLVVMLIVISGLIVLWAGTWWGWVTAKRGATCAVLLAMTSYSFGVGWHLTQVRASDPSEKWVDHGVSPSLRLLLETVEGISIRTVGNSRDVEITVLGSADGLLGWELREFERVAWVDKLGSITSSPIVITPSGVDIEGLGEGYLGQEFAFVGHQKESVRTPAEWLRYMMFREAEVVHDRLVVWVRQDSQLD